MSIIVKRPLSPSPTVSEAGGLDLVLRPPAYGIVTAVQRFRSGDAEPHRKRHILHLDFNGRVQKFTSDVLSAQFRFPLS
jgi:hypothetical protein